MSPHSNYHEKPRIIRRILLSLLVCLLCVGVLAAFWFLSQLGPKEVSLDESGYVANDVTPELLALAERSRDLETRFDEVVNVRGIGVDAISLLKESLDLQEEYVSQVQAYDSEAIDRRDRLRRKYQNLAADELKERSRELEKAGDDLLRAEDFEGAKVRFEEAAKYQREINENYPLSAAYDVGRSAYLQRQIQHASALPLQNRSIALEAEADQLIKMEDWLGAEEKLNQAISIQENLNRNFRNSVQASVSRVEDLKTKRLRIRSGQSYLEIKRIEALAEERFSANKMAEAASFYEEAVRLQRELNEAFPSSPYASSELVVDFQRKNETAQSYQLGLEIEENHDRLRQLLANRRAFEAAEVIVELQRQIRQMQEVYPKSSLNDEELQIKVRYLTLLQSDLTYIQDRVYDLMLPVPQVNGWVMSKTEVTQALYNLIMGTNPSRNVGEQLPVDSVSWTEAKRFCTRMAWIMGHEVRLPTEYEYRQALGRLRYVVLENHVWSAEDSGGVAKSVASKDPLNDGFYDLLGNVSEWLEYEDPYENKNAQHIGGHAQDRLESIFTVPIREAPRGERNRLTGFRIVMALNDGSK